MPETRPAETAATLLADLAAEQRSVDGLVSTLDEPGWEAPTPAVGWTVRDQISHLAAVDRWAVEAASDPERFTAWMASQPLDDADAVVNEPVAAARGRPGGEVLAWWREERAALHRVLGALDPSTRVPWFGPPMSLPSMVTARIMETWAHGEDVADALGVPRPPTARLRHIAHLGVRTRRFSYATRGLPPPPGDVRVEVEGPGGERWSWGDEGSDDRVSGNAFDFCLVVTRRRHPDDTALRIEGPMAREWMSIAQAFAGPPGADPEPRRP